MLCFRIFPVVEKILGKRPRSFKFFLSKLFLSHKAENFRGGMFYCCNSFGYRKGLDKREGSVKVFHRSFFVSECRKTS